MRLTSANTDALAPSPMASTQSTPIVKVRRRRRVRTLNLTSCASASSHGIRSASRVLSMTASTPPSSTRAARRAAEGVMPSAMLRSVCAFRWNSICRGEPAPFAFGGG